MSKPKTSAAGRHSGKDPARHLPALAAIGLSCCLQVLGDAHPGLRVAMVQLDVVDGALAENMKRARKGIERAARMKADLICLPEAADFGWLCQQAREVALPIPGSYTDLLCKLARRHGVWISAGCLERDGARTYNAAVLINRSGTVVLKHRKIATLPELTSHLYDAGRSEDISVVDTEFGRVGLTICADNFSAENPRRVAELGAWLLIAPHGFAEKESDLADNAVSYMNHIKRVAQGAGLWVIGTDTALSRVAGGAWAGYLHSGCSMIASPAGKAVALGKFKEPDLVICDIPAEE
jgi:predicted amidohydrolase